MPRARIEVEGGAELRRQLGKLGAEAEDLKTILAYAADPVLDQAEREAPVLTGATKASIRLGGGKTRATIRAGFARLNYVPIVHFHPEYGNPWLYTAADKTRDQVPERVQEALNRLMDRIID